VARTDSCSDAVSCEDGMCGVTNIVAGIDAEPSAGNCVVGAATGTRARYFIIAAEAISGETADTFAVVCAAAGLAARCLTCLAAGARMGACVDKDSDPCAGADEGDTLSAGAADTIEEDAEGDARTGNGAGDSKSICARADVCGGADVGARDEASEVFGFICKPGGPVCAVADAGAIEERAV
jgi:hypothetical protein